MMQEKTESRRVLLLYTGGTIGMKMSPRGYIPGEGLHLFLSKVPQFHRSDLTKENIQELDEMNENRFPYLVLPANKYNHTVIYDVMEYKPLLDSSNMSQSDWLRIAKDIVKYYDDYFSFVIVHGTDTMAYSASALSFILHNLSKTVIFTGSQLSLREPLSDGHQNLLGAITIAGQFVIPEVTLFFNQKLFRGNCSRKLSATDFDAFGAPPRACLGTIDGHGVKVNWNLIFFNDSDRMPLYCADDFNPNVAVCRIFPGMTKEILSNFLQPPVQGVVLECFGSGNAPDTSESFLKALQSAAKRGVVICAITQCISGVATPSYAAGQSLIESGVVFCRDMTCEAAIAKLSKLLARGFTIERVRHYMQTNLRGEMTEPEDPIYNFFSSGLMNLSLRGSRNSDEIAEMNTKLLPIISSSEGFLSGLKLLSDKSVQVSDLVDNNGRTALHYGAMFGDEGVVDYLCEEKKADMHKKDMNGRRPIDIAELNEVPHIVNYFISKGVQRNPLFSRSQPSTDIFKSSTV